MRLENFKILTSVVIFVVIFCMWTTVFKFFYATYMFGLDNIDFLKIMWDYDFIKTHYQDIIDLFVDWLPILIKYVLIYIGLKVVLYLFRKFTIPTVLIKKWLTNNEISPILGRMFVYHYRNSFFLNIEQFREIMRYSRIERAYIMHHKKNKNLIELFEKFDPNWSYDVKEDV